MLRCVEELSELNDVRAAVVAAHWIHAARLQYTPFTPTFLTRFTSALLRLHGHVKLSSNLKFPHHTRTVTPRRDRCCTQNHSGPSDVRCPLVAFYCIYFADNTHLSREEHALHR